MTTPDWLRERSLIWLPLLTLSLAGCSSIDDRNSPFETGGTSSKKAHRISSSGAFPVPDEIQDNVAFWRNVYGQWSRGQVAIHDDEHMGVIYEVADLPGPVLGGYTTEQKRFVRARAAHYKSRLEILEDKLRSGQAPSGYEKDLFEKLVDAGGKRAVYGASERVRVQRGLRERFRRGLEISGRYDDAFREVFRSRGLPEDLAYLPHVESSFQAHARSSVGAAGMWQFTRGAGKRYMTVNGKIDERLDPVSAAEGAARYLSDAYRKLDSWPLAVTSYNHGQGGMASAKAMYGDDIGAIVRKYKGPRFKFASRNFYAEFLAAREVASRPERYFPEGIRYQSADSNDRLVLRHSMPAHHVARHYGLSSYRLADLNAHWLNAAREGRVNLPAGSTVWLPPGTSSRVRGEPEPMPVMVADLEQEPKPVRLAMADLKAKSRSAAKVAATPKLKPLKIAKAKPSGGIIKVADAANLSSPSVRKKAAASAGSKVHVVKPSETLYRVSTYYDLSVDELRRLNRMGPEDTNIRVGQRLRVSGL